MRIKPTLRKSGVYMCTYRVPVHIGLTDIINAAIFRQIHYGDPLPSNRQKAIRCALRYIQNYGDQYLFEMEKETRMELGPSYAKHMARLFPDLAMGVDLSDYGYSQHDSTQPPV